MHTKNLNEYKQLEDKMIMTSIFSMHKVHIEVKLKDQNSFPKKHTTRQIEPLLSKTLLIIMG